MDFIKYEKKFNPQILEKMEKNLNYEKEFLKDNNYYINNVTNEEVEEKKVVNNNVENSNNNQNFDVSKMLKLLGGQNKSKDLLSLLGSSGLFGNNKEMQLLLGMVQQMNKNTKNHPKTQKKINLDKDYDVIEE